MRVLNFEVLRCVKTRPIPPSFSDPNTHPLTGNIEKKQRAYYSGKQKRHTLKGQLGHRLSYRAVPNGRQWPSRNP